MMTAQPVRNIGAALEHITKPWQPHRIATINNYDLKAVKLQGEFVWHEHVETDELFYVLSGELMIDIRTPLTEGQIQESVIKLGPGDVYVVPKRVPHRPRAPQLVTALLFEPQGVVNTGNATDSSLTSKVHELE